MSDLLETFRRYEKLIEAIVPSDSAAAKSPAESREVYAPLLAYKRTIDFKREYETVSTKSFGHIEDEIRDTGDRMQIETDFQTPSGVMAWSGLALYVGGKLIIRDAWTDMAGDAFGRLARSQQDNGRLLPVTSSSNPEASWYDELATLHAMADFAVQAEDRTIARAVTKAANFIAAEIEPDHATGQPWGLFAFIWNAPTRPLADQLIHAAQLRRNELDAVSLILLQDALYCLRLFVSR